MLSSTWASRNVSLSVRAASGSAGAVGLDYTNLAPMLGYNSEHAGWQALHCRQHCQAKTLDM